MKTRKFCPKCGRPLLRSDLSKTENAYKFQCFACDDDFWRFEVYSTKNIAIVRRIQRMTYFEELADGLPPTSVKKPYRRPQPTKHQKVNHHGKIIKRPRR